jgi:putative exporter of polyketide antibiotics
MSENEGLMNFLGISDWDNVFTLEGMVTTYFMNLFVPILVAISTIVLLNKMSAKAEEDGTFEFVASLPMTRGTIYLTHSIVAVMFGIFISQSWFHIMYIPMATMTLSQTMDYAPMIQAGFQSALGGVSYGVLGFSIAAYTGKSSNGWTFGMGLLGIEWISNMLSRTNDIFLWIDENISSFGAYGNPYKDGLDTGDITLVVAKILIFLVIGFIGFRNRSLNLR